MVVVHYNMTTVLFLTRCNCFKSIIEMSDGIRSLGEGTLTEGGCLMPRITLACIGTVDTRRPLTKRKLPGKQKVEVYIRYICIDL
jgi:hypothetical protein